MGFFLYFLSAAHLFTSDPSQLPVSFSRFAHLNKVNSRYLDHSTCQSEDDNKYTLSHTVCFQTQGEKTVEKDYKTEMSTLPDSESTANNETAFRKAEVVTSLFVFASAPLQCFKIISEPPRVSTSSSC